MIFLSTLAPLDGSLPCDRAMAVGSSLASAASSSAFFSSFSTRAASVMFSLNERSSLPSRRLWESWGACSWASPVWGLPKSHQYFCGVKGGRKMKGASDEV